MTNPCDTSDNNNNNEHGDCNPLGIREASPTNKHLSVLEDHRVKPLYNSQVTSEDKLPFERPFDKDTAEEVIKATETDMLRLRHTREQIKKTEQEQKHKREQ
eukprot:g7420.t1